MKFKKIVRNTSSEVIVKQILESLEQGDLKPGQKLPSEREMSELFGVCRASVREAARALTLMGYLDVYQGKGAYLKEELPVRTDSAERLNRAMVASNSLDLVDMRNMLECKAAYQAAARAQPAQIAEIKRSVDKMRRFRADVGKFLEADLEFHMAVIRASNNQLLREIMELIHPRVVKDRREFLGAEELRVADCIRTSTRTLEAIDQGDSEAAMASLSEHLNLVNQEIREVVLSQGQPAKKAKAG